MVHFRYRGESVGNMGVEKLYKVKEEIQRLDKLSKEIVKNLAAIDKEKKLTSAVASTIVGCTTMSALEIGKSHFQSIA